MTVSSRRPATAEQAWHRACSRTEGKNPTTNAGDRVYAQQENGANLLALSGDDRAGYTAAVTIVLPITGNGPGGP